MVQLANNLLLASMASWVNFDDDERGLRTSAFCTLSVFGTLLGALARVVYSTQWLEKGKINSAVSRI